MSSEALANVTAVGRSLVVDYGLAPSIELEQAFCALRRLGAAITQAGSRLTAVFLCDWEVRRGEREGRAAVEVLDAAGGRAAVVTAFDSSDQGAATRVLIRGDDVVWRTYDVPGVAFERDVKVLAANLRRFVDPERPVNSGIDAGPPAAARTPGDLDPTGLFLPYFGNHHKTLPAPPWRQGGPVSFTAHLGKPLSQALWDDLLQRLGARTLLVYRAGDAPWAYGWGGYTARVFLDRDGKVAEIQWHPPLGVKVDVNTPHVEELGVAVLDTKGALQADLGDFDPTAAARIEFQDADGGTPTAPGQAEPAKPIVPLETIEGTLVIVELYDSPVAFGRAELRAPGILLPFAFGVLREELARLVRGCRRVDSIKADQLDRLFGNAVRPDQRQAPLAPVLPFLVDRTRLLETQDGWVRVVIRGDAAGALAPFVGRPAVLTWR